MLHFLSIETENKVLDFADFIWRFVFGVRFIGTVVTLLVHDPRYECTARNLLSRCFSVNGQNGINQ